MAVRNFIIVMLVLAGCGRQQPVEENTASSGTPGQIKPKYATPALPHDSDDPAIWYNEDDPAASMIVGTDKNEGNGGLYSFDLKGNIEGYPRVYPMDRPNNVDIAKDMVVGDSLMDIAVVAERMTASIRVYSMPGLVPLDNGGIRVFEDDTANAVMGVAMYTRPSDQKIFAIVSRKSNPVDEDDYLYQYELFDDNGAVNGRLVRKFGKFSGKAEIEAIAVDNELGYVYYSDEMFGIRKYYADPDKGNEELAVFGKAGFAEDREGITIYKHRDGTGYILVSDQGANKFRVFPRQGTVGNPNNHDEIAVLSLSTLSSDGSEVSSNYFSEEFPEGIFVAMSDNRTFEIYDWRDLEREILRQIAENQDL